MTLTPNPTPPDRPDDDTNEFDRIDITIPPEIQFEIERYGRLVDRMLLPEAKQQLKALYYSHCAIKLLAKELTKAQFDRGTLDALVKERTDRRNCEASLEATTIELAIARAALEDRGETIANLEAIVQDLRRELAAAQLLKEILSVNEEEGDRNA